MAQNDTIGFVGQTGWATGPHLHYEFRVAGEARNPLSIAMPAALPVAQQDLPAFRTHAAPLVARLDLLANSHARAARVGIQQKQKGPEGPFFIAWQVLARRRTTTRSRRWSARSGS